MITIVITKKTDYIQSIEISGHANFSTYGSDIVCSAISVLAVTLINSIEQLAKIVPLHEVNQTEGGYLYVSSDRSMTEEQHLITQLLMQSFVIGVEDIQVEYSQYVKIERRQI